jgi:hypothetical protein
MSSTRSPRSWFRILAAVISVAACASSGAVSSSRGTADTSADRNWLATIGWQRVSYREGNESVTLEIEPMMSGPDLIFVPDPDTWKKFAPATYRDRRETVLARLKAVPWNRELAWLDAPTGFGTEKVTPGSIQSTAGGAEF